MHRRFRLQNTKQCLAFNLMSTGVTHSSSVERNFVCKTKDTEAKNNDDEKQNIQMCKRTHSPKWLERT